MQSCARRGAAVARRFVVASSRNALRESELFEGLTSEQTARLEGLADVVRAQAGTELFRSGDPASHLYVVLDGAVELHMTVPEWWGIDTDRRKVSTAGAGHVVGWSAMAQPAAYSLSAVCREKTTLARFNAADIAEATANDPHHGPDAALAHPPHRLGAVRPAGRGDARPARRAGLPERQPGRAQPLAPLPFLPLRGEMPAGQRGSARVSPKGGTILLFAMTDAPTPRTYAESGVDADAAAAGLSGLLAWVRETRDFREGAGEQLVPNGFFASVLRLTDRLSLAISTDGVGSKSVLAQLTGDFEAIGWDCVAVNVNDVVCVGAQPFALVDYIALQFPPRGHALRAWEGDARRRRTRPRRHRRRRTLAAPGHTDRPPARLRLRHIGDVRRAARRRRAHHRRPHRAGRRSGRDAQRRRARERADARPQRAAAGRPRRRRALAAGVRAHGWRGAAAPHAHLRPRGARDARRGGPMSGASRTYRATACSTCSGSTPRSSTGSTPCRRSRRCSRSSGARGTSLRRRCTGSTTWVWASAPSFRRVTPTPRSRR